MFDLLGRFEHLPVFWASVFSHWTALFGFELSNPPLCRLLNPEHLSPEQVPVPSPGLHQGMVGCGQLEPGWVGNALGSLTCLSAKQSLRFGWFELPDVGLGQGCTVVSSASLGGIMHIITVHLSQACVPQTT